MKVIIADLSAFGGEDTKKLVNGLPPARREVLLRYRKERDRARGAVGEALLRLALSQSTGVPPQKLSIVRTPEGKPMLAGGPCFNLSHSGDAVAFVSGPRPVGIDVEKIRDMDYSPVAKRCFSEREREEIMRAQDPLAAFFRLWTARESALKLHGTGIADMRRLTMSDGYAFLDGERLGAVVSRVISDRFSDEYALSVCTNGEHEEELLFCGAKEVSDAYFSALQTI